MDMLIKECAGLSLVRLWTVRLRESGGPMQDHREWVKKSPVFKKLKLPWFQSGIQLVFKHFD
jgi:hypothetical protein